MIIDSLKSFERYINLHKSFGKVYSFLRENDLHALTDGKYVIEENNIWCTVSSAAGKGLEELAPLEVHDSFVDIHVILEGTETIGFRDRAKCDGTDTKYDDSTDTAILLEEPEAFVSYADDNFVICFPQDAHAPMMGNGNIRKAVFKVRL